MATTAEQTKSATPNEMTTEQIEEILQRIVDGFRQPDANAVNASAAIMRTSLQP